MPVPLRVRAEVPAAALGSLGRTPTFVPLAGRRHALWSKSALSSPPGKIQWRWNFIAFSNCARACLPNSSPLPEPIRGDRVPVHSGISKAVSAVSPTNPTLLGRRVTATRSCKYHRKHLTPFPSDHCLQRKWAQGHKADQLGEGRAVLTLTCR